MGSGLLSFLFKDVTQQKGLVDIILMAALADGALSQKTKDRIARALGTYVELEGVEWDWVSERAAELELDAPLFSDARAQLAESLTDPDTRRTGISLAAKIVSAENPLSDSQRAILGTIAESFRIPDEETSDLMLPWETSDVAPGYQRVSCNDPANPEAPSIFDALARTKSDQQTRLLLFKLSATRRVLDFGLTGSTLAAVGEPLRVGPYAYRPDALIDTEDGGQWILRCLAEGEALNLAEPQVLSALQARLNDRSGLYVAHQGEICPPDEAFFRGLDQTRLRIEKIEI